MREFFEFFEKHGINWWMVEGQPRLKTAGPKYGKRGAPIGTRFGFKFAVRAPQVPEAFKTLSARLLVAGKGLVDLQTRASSLGGDSWRVLLVDDLDQAGMDALRSWWTGPLALLETSEGNFQALLVSPRALTKEQLGHCLKQLVRRFDADPGAARAAQLHRFPGSPNFKNCMHGKAAFLCRLIALVDGAPGGGAAQLNELLSSSASPAPAARRPGPALQLVSSAPRPIGPGLDPTDSAVAFRWAMSAVVRGVPDHEVLAELGGRLLGKHDAARWPKYTLEKAKFFTKRSALPPTWGA